MNLSEQALEAIDQDKIPDKIKKVLAKSGHRQAHVERGDGPGIWVAGPIKTTVLADSDATDLVKAGVVSFIVDGKGLTLIFEE